MLNTRFVTLVLIILAAAAMRLIPHPPNVTPIAAMALFGAAHFASRKSGFLVLLMAMGLSDIVLGLVIYGYGWVHGTMPFVYFSFALTFCFGLVIRNRLSPLSIGAAVLGSSLLFFLATNFGVWLTGGLYPISMDGLIACYVAAIPYYKNTLAGDALYTLLLFGGFALAQRYLPVLRAQSVAMMEPPAGAGRGA